MIQTMQLLLLMVPLRAQVNYDLQIQPIFNSKCIECHGSSAGLNLSSYENLMSGSNNGDVIIPYDHALSELWIRVNSGQMPPGNNDLTAAQVNLISQWIDEGALPIWVGDINNDGTLNVLDVVLMANIVLANDYDAIADMNGDGVINIQDIVILINNIFR